VNELVKQGDRLTARGGWPVEVIWVAARDPHDGFYAIHKPGELFLESVPIYHQEGGEATGAFAVNEPPRYDKPHPADIIMPPERPVSTEQAAAEAAITT